jgi:hypothetical protein
MVTTHERAGPVQVARGLAWVSLVTAAVALVTDGASDWWVCNGRARARGRHGVCLP